MDFFEKVITKYTEQKIPLKYNNTVDDLIDQMDKYVDQFLSEKTTYKQTNLTIDLIQYKEGLLDKIITELPTKFKQVTILQQKYLILCISEGSLQYVVYIYKKRQNKFNLFNFILYIYRYIENTHAIDQLFQDKISQFIVNSYVSTFKIKEASTFEKNRDITKQFFKNQKNNPIKYQLNKQIQEIIPLLVEIDTNTIKEIFIKYIQYQPVFSNITSLLRILFPDKFYGIYLKQSQTKNQEKGQELPIIYLNCVDIPVNLCKTHTFNGILVNIGSTNEHLEIISRPTHKESPILYDPMIQCCSPLYAFYQQYSYDQRFQGLELLIALYTATTIIIQKNRDSYVIQRFYSKRGKSIPNVQNCHEHLKLNLIYMLNKNTLQDLGESRL